MKQPLLLIIAAFSIFLSQAGIGNSVEDDVKAGISRKMTTKEGHFGGANTKNPAGSDSACEEELLRQNRFKKERRTKRESDDVFSFAYSDGSGRGFGEGFVGGGSRWQSDYPREVSTGQGGYKSRSFADSRPGYGVGFGAGEGFASGRKVYFGKGIGYGSATRTGAGVGYGRGIYVTDGTVKGYGIGIGIGGAQGTSFASGEGFNEWDNKDSGFGRGTGGASGRDVIEGNYPTGPRSQGSDVEVGGYPTGPRSDESSVGVRNGGRQGIGFDFRGGFPEESDNRGSVFGRGSGSASGRGVIKEGYPAGPRSGGSGVGVRNGGGQGISFASSAGFPEERNNKGFGFGRGAGRIGPRGGGSGVDPSYNEEFGEKSGKRVAIGEAIGARNGGTVRGIGIEVEDGWARGRGRGVVNVDGRDSSYYGADKDRDRDPINAEGTEIHYDKNNPGKTVAGPGNANVDGVGSANYGADKDRDRDPINAEGTEIHFDKGGPGKKVDSPGIANVGGTGSSNYNADKDIQRDAIHAQGSKISD